MSALNRIAVASLLLGLQVTAAVADDPPKLDVTTTCNAAAQFSIVIGGTRRPVSTTSVQRKAPLPKIGRNPATKSYRVPACVGIRQRGLVHGELPHLAQGPSASHVCFFVMASSDRSNKT